MEQAFGVVLFNRNTREVALTDLGVAWLPQVQQAVSGVDAVVQNLVTLSGTRQGRLRFGYLIGTGADLLFRIVRHFEAAYPEVSVEPIEFDLADPTAGLADGRTEAALIRPPVDLPEHRMMILDSESWVAMFIGTEVIEAGCTSIAGHRLKLSAWAAPSPPTQPDHRPRHRLDRAPTVRVRDRPRLPAHLSHTLVFAHGG